MHLLFSLNYKSFVEIWIYYISHPSIHISISPLPWQGDNRIVESIKILFLGAKETHEFVNRQRIIDIKLYTKPKFFPFKMHKI